MERIGRPLKPIFLIILQRLIATNYLTNQKGRIGRALKL
jgi:hypothetical protein